MLSDSFNKDGYAIDDDFLPEDTAKKTL